MELLYVRNLGLIIRCSAVFTGRGISDMLATQQLASVNMHDNLPLVKAHTCISMNITHTQRTYDLHLLAYCVWDKQRQNFQQSEKKL